MADKEAKIQFKAETEEFQSAIKAANSEMSSLRSEMKLNESQFQNSGDKAEYLENKTQLLEQQLAANREKQEALNAEIEVATQIYGEDSQEVANLEKQLNYTMAQEQQLESQLASTTAELEANDSATGQLTSTIEQQESELAALKDEYANAVLAYGENSDEANRLAGEITSLSTELAENKSQMAEARQAADELDVSMADAGDATSSAADTMAEALAGAGVVAALKEIGDAAIEMASDFSDASATIVEGTGASGEALEQLQDATIKSFSGMKDADADLNDVASVVAELNTRLGITGDEASTTADKFLKFAQHVDTDATGAVDNVVDVMKRWGDESLDLDSLLDDLTTANQACALSVDEMTKYLSENSTQFMELGYSQTDALALMTSLSDGGANVSSVMMGMKQAVKNLATATDDVPGAFQQAIDAIGECDSVSEALNAQVGDTGKTVADVFGSKAAQEIATCVQNGNLDIASFTAMLEDNQGAMEDTATHATSMGDEMSRVSNNVAVVFDSIFAPALSSVIGGVADLVGGFGEVVRDSPVLQGVLVAVATALGILAAALAISSLIQAVQKAFSLLNLTMLANPIFLVITAIAALVAAIVFLWNNCEEFRNVVMAVWDAIQTAIGVVVDWFVANVVPLFQTAIEGIAGFFQSMWQVITTVWDAIYSVISTVVGFIIAFVMAYFQTLFNFWSTIWNAIWSVVSTIWDSIRNTVSTVINAVWTVISSVLGAISSTWSSIWTAVSTTASNIWNGIRNTISTVINAVSTVVSSVVNAISSTVSSVFNAIWNTVSNVWNGIKSAIETPINAAKGIVENAINAIKGFFNFQIQWPHIPMPHFGINPPGWKIGDLLQGSIPSLSIEFYAKGGIMRSPTIFGFNGNSAMVGGEAGDEAIAPIETLQTYIDAAVQRNLGGLGELAEIRRSVDDLHADLGEIIAEYAPDGWPGDRAFRGALRRAGVSFDV